MHFTGREVLLAELRAKLHETVSKQWNHRVALYGLGGVGKTQLALQYVHSQRAHYEWVYWISGDSETALFSGFQEIAKQTNCCSADANIKDVAKGVLSWLNQKEKFLLVIDNVDDVGVVDGYLPEISPGRHTLITTRNQYVGDIPAEGIEVGNLSLDDAIELLLVRTQARGITKTPEVECEAAQIVKELGFLPLAIEQAAAYIREVSKDLFKFLPSYRTNRKWHHKRLVKGNRNYSKSVATTWHLSFQQLEANHSDATQLLRFFAFLNPDGILTEFLEAGKEGLTENGLREVISDQDRFFDCLSELERFSLIARQNDHQNGQRITVHRLVQCVIKDEMLDEVFTVMTSNLIGLYESAFPRWDQDHEVREITIRLRCRRYQDQIMLPLTTTVPKNASKLGNLLLRFGMFLDTDGNYQKASELIAEAVQIKKEMGGAKHPDTLKATGKLASTYRKMGQWEDAAKLQEQVIEAMIRVLGEHPDTLTVMGHLAVTYGCQGRWGDAAKLQEKVMEGTTRVLGEDHPDTLMAMGKLAATYWYLGKWVDSVKLEEKVLEATTRVLGEDHLDTLTAMVNLGVTYRHQGRWEDAAKLHGKVVEARTRLLGEEHPNTLTAMANQAITYRSQGQLEDATILQEKVLDVTTRLFGEHHPSSLNAMSQLGVTYRDQGRLHDSIKLLERALKGQIKVGGGEHPNALIMMGSLGIAYQMSGRFDDSIMLFEKALETQKKVLGNEHPDTLRLISRLAVTYREAGRRHDSVELLQIAVEAQKRIHGDEHPDTLWSIKELEIGTQDIQEGIW
jgi:tetratricopeptide (TPR) repeat protein